MPNSWINQGWGHRANTVDELMRSVSRIGTLQSGRRYVWRGAKNASWRVQTSLQRYVAKNHPDLSLGREADIRLLERRVIKVARAWHLDRGGTLPDQALLALLQHHGSPTRLLDVTSDPMTALWFACEQTGDSRDTSGALFAFDVTDLQVLDTNAAQMIQTWAGIKEPLAFQFAQALRRSEESGQPFLIEPSERDARMVAQQGLFLCGATRQESAIRGVDAFSMEAEPPGQERLSALFDVLDRRRGRPAKVPFVALVLPARLKSRMRSHLAGTYSKERRTLFPDLSGLAAAIDLRAVSFDTSLKDQPR